MGRPITRNPYVSPRDTLRADFGIGETRFEPADALFSPSQQRVLACLFGQPQRAFSVSELIAESSAGSGATQRELARLSASGLVSVHIEGTQRRYQANAYAPIYPELVAIVRKAVRVSPQLPLLENHRPRKRSTRNRA